jgi:hypothetical protein
MVFSINVILNANWDKCENTEAPSKGCIVRQFANIARVARRKLRQLRLPVDWMTFGFCLALILRHSNIAQPETGADYLHLCSDLC